MVSERRRTRGRRIASLYRQERGLDGVRQCPLDELLTVDSVELAESHLGDPGYLGALIRPPYSPCPGILLAPGQTPGQRRFSIAHELGHLHIPTHAKVVGTCASDDMSAGAPTMELEANDFAAELLMPRNLFREDVGEPPTGFETLYDITDDYGVSVTAAARRLVELAREACAVILVEKGRVRWIQRSRPWTRRSLALPMWVGDRVAEESATAALLRGEQIGPELHEVDPACWLTRANSHEVLESVHAIPEHGAVLTLIWALED